MKRATGIILLFLCISYTFAASSCGDFGSISDELAYYAAFGSVNFVCRSDSENPEIRSFDMTDIYCKESISANMVMMYEDTYKYIAVEAKKNMSVDDMAVWFYSTTFSGDMMFDLYLADSFSYTYHANNDQKEKGCYEGTRTTIKNLKKVTETYSFDFDGAPVYDGKTKVADGKVTVNDGGLRDPVNYTMDLSGDNPVAEFDLSYSVTAAGGSVNNYNYHFKCTFDVKYSVFVVSCCDLDRGDYIYSNLRCYYEGEHAGEEEAGLTNKICSCSLELEKDEWGSFMADTWTVNDTERDTFDILKGQYIYVKIKNNCNGAFRFDLEQAGFCSNNVMIRALGVN